MIRKAAGTAWRAFMRFQDHSGPDRAAAVAYYTMLSLLPLLVFLISIGVAVMGSFERAYRGAMYLIGGVVVHLDQGTLDALRTFVERSLRFRWPALLLLAWTARRIFGSLFSALERVFGVAGRSFARGNLLALGSVLVAGAALLLTMAGTLLIATGEGVVERLVGPRGAGALHMVIGILVARVVPVFVGFVFFFLVYRVVPRRVVSTRHAAIGALLATALWELAKGGFAYYLRNLARVSGLYGALEGIIVLAIWLELSVSIILYCAEVVALLINRRRPVPGSRPSVEAAAR